MDCRVASLVAMTDGIHYFNLKNNMSNLKQLRLRIKSVKSTKKITKAMQMISAAKLRKARIGLENAHYYHDSVRESAQ